MIILHVNRVYLRTEFGCLGHHAIPGPRRQAMRERRENAKEETQTNDSNRKFLPSFRSVFREADSEKSRQTAKEEK